MTILPLTDNAARNDLPNTYTNFIRSWTFSRFTSAIGLQAARVDARTSLKRLLREDSLRKLTIAS